MRAGDVAGRRIDTISVLFAASAGLAAIVLLWLGQGLTFFADEWAVVEGRRLDLDSFLRPFNEHWLGSTILVYRALFELIGLSSYVPYLALLIALHLVVAGEVFVLVRRPAGSWLALAAGVGFLFFGSGFEDLFWGLQIGFVGPVALGLGAVLALDPGEPVAAEVGGQPLPRTAGHGPSWPRIVLAMVLLTVGVTSSGIGLVMLVAVGVEAIVEVGARRRRAGTLLAVAVPGGIYVAWFLAFDRGGVGAARNPFTPSALAELPGFVARGGAAAAGAVTGLGPTLGLLVVVVLVVAVAWRLVTRRAVPSRTLGCLSGIVALYVLTGLIRAQLAVDAALYTRYLYVSGVLLIVGAAALVGPGLRAWAARPTSRPAVLAGAGVLIVLSLAFNVRLLAEGRQIFVERADRTRALVTVALAPLPAGVETDRTLILIPSPDSVRQIVSGHGSPLVDSLVLGGLRPIPADALADAHRRLEERAGVIGPLPQ